MDSGSTKMLLSMPLLREFEIGLPLMDLALLIDGMGMGKNRQIESGTDSSVPEQNRRTPVFRAVDD